MFNFLKKKQKEFIFSNLYRMLYSFYLEEKLKNKWFVNFIKQSEKLKIPKEEIEKKLEKITLDLKNSDIEFIWQVFKNLNNQNDQTELFLKFRIWKYFLYVACTNGYDNYYWMHPYNLENFKDFSEQLKKCLNSKNSFVIFDNNLKLFRNIKFAYEENFLVFWKMYLNLDFLSGYWFLAEKISEYVNSFWKIILNKFLLEISETERKELEKYLKEIEIIWAKNIEVAREFSPVFQKAKRLSEISNEIKNLNLEIQNIRKSI